MIDLAQLTAARLAELAQISDRAELELRATALLGIIFPTHEARLVWHSGALEPPHDGALLAQLAAGETAEDADGAAAFFPLRALGELIGWFELRPGVWSEEQAQWLGLLAALVATTAQARQQAPDQAQQRSALRAAIDELNGASAVGPLLDSLSRIIRRTVPSIQMLWVLRYHDSEWASLAASTSNRDSQAARVYWKATAGLSGVVMESGAPLYAENYWDACAARGVAPLLVGEPATSYGWLGIPLCEGDQTFGALICYSDHQSQSLDEGTRELLLWVAGQVARLIRGAQRYQLAAEQARQRETLNQIARAITSSLDPEYVPALIVEQSPVLLNAEEASLLLLDEGTGDLVFRYAAGPAGQSLLGQRVPAGEGVAGFVASSGEPSIVNDTSGDGRFYGALDGSTGFETRSILAVPLRSIDGVKGVIEVLNRRDNAPFTRYDQELLEALADQATIALDNAQQFASKDRALARRAQELDRSNDRLRKILRASNALRAERQIDDLAGQIVDVVSTSSGFRRAMIALAHRERAPEPYLQAAAVAGIVGGRPGEAHVSLARFEALLRPEFRRGSLTYLMERAPLEYSLLWGKSRARPQVLSRRPGSWQQSDALFCLLRDSRGEVIGLLGVNEPEDSQRPTPEQVQILEILANQAAAAIENAALYAAQQHSLSRMMALNGLGRAISTTLRAPQQIYELTASGMLEMSSARWATVFLGDPAEAGFGEAFHTGQRRGDGGMAQQLARETAAARRPLSRLPGPESEGMLGIPLQGSSRTLGAICVGYGEGMPDAGDLESLILFASQAAAAVESLQLLSAVRLGRDRLASIMASTREGMLLVGDDGRVEVANNAFFQLAETRLWADTPANLAGMPMGALLASWQFAANFPPADLEQLHSGVAAVADGLESFVGGQLNGTHIGAKSLEWSVLRATREGGLGLMAGDAEEPRRRPILLTVRDITAMKETERLRADLTNMMVHDLRSPLTSIMSSIDLIFRGVTGAIGNQQREVLTIAYGSAQNLLNMINLLLDIGRLEGGSMPMDRAFVATASLAELALGNMRLLAESKGIGLQHQPAHQERNVYADRDLVLRVLQNLMDNALKFSKQGDVVVLETALDSEHAGFVRFAVRDAGIGIKASDLDKIFVKFGQVGNRRSAGSGLGLTFCKLVVETHGGKMWVESAPGVGSSFFFTLPCGVVEAGK
jgi:signal transduction histidine kinase/transcriptional regulator with GAF, ATPase, and Fis domain